MNYEQKYKEALDAARHIYDDMKSGGNFGGMEDLEVIFPELRESEDERIRKAIIDALYSHTNSINVLSSKGYSMDDVIAYLEKQKEQKPAEKQDYSELNDLERAIHRGFLAAGVENVPVGIIKETAKEGLAQMKPAEWSEEDELMRTAVIQTLERFGGRGTTEMQIAWLKSLRPSWKPSEKKVKPLKNVPPIESIMK